MSEMSDLYYLREPRLCFPRNYITSSLWNAVMNILDVFVSGSRDVLTRRLFQLPICHLDLALVSDEVGCLRLTPCELKKLQTNANEVKRGQKSTLAR